MTVPVSTITVRVINNATGDTKNTNLQPNTTLDGALSFFAVDRSKWTASVVRGPSSSAGANDALEEGDTILLIPKKSDGGTR